jgi:hypothetical protein
MDILARIRTFLAARSESTSLAPRRERREAARRRHHETGESSWTAQDRHLGADGEQVVSDVAPGTPGHFGSVHTGRDD